MAAAGKIIPPGSEFGRLTVISDAQRPPHAYGKHFLCKCACGNQVIVGGGALRNGGTKSCGCLRNDNRRKAWKSSRTHGHCVNDEQSRTYYTWRAMLLRCHKSNHKEFHRYGARGISVCKAWRDSFAAFLNDMGERPEGMTIDRIDNRFGYFTANCRWATAKAQASNRKQLRKNYLDAFPKAASWLAQSPFRAPHV